MAGRSVPVAGRVGPEWGWAVAGALPLLDGGAGPETQGAVERGALRGGVQHQVRRGGGCDRGLHQGAAEPSALLVRRHLDQADGGAAGAEREPHRGPYQAIPRPDGEAVAEAQEHRPVLRPVRPAEPGGERRRRRRVTQFQPVHPAPPDNIVQE